MTNDAQPMEDPDIIRAERVSKRYEDGQVLALSDVSFRVGRGDYVAVMGPSGSGKSTLLHLMGGLDRPTEGEVVINNQRLSTMKRLDRLRSSTIGFVFQTFELIPTLTALENVQIPMFEHVDSARRRQQRAEQLLASVAMTDRGTHIPSKLSIGQRQRVAIARALANDPPILLADEPTGNLDSRTGGDVLDLFDRLRHENGITTVVITHSPEVAERADWVLRLRDGRIVERE